MARTSEKKTQPMNPAPESDRTAIASLRHGDYVAFFRFAAVGGAQNAIFYCIGLVLLWFHVAAWQALLVFYPIAVGISFLANRSWAFRERSASSPQFRSYILVYIAAYPLSISLSWLQERAGIPSWFSMLATMVVVAVGIFLLLNFWVFRERVKV